MAEPTPEHIIDQLIDRLAEGHGLATICRDPNMPNARTVYRWMQSDDEMAARVREAREVGFYERAERAVEEVRNAADPIKARVIFDSERWYLGKLSLAFADKPVVGLAVSVDAGDAFAAVAGVLEGAAAAISSRRDRTIAVVEHREAGSDNAAG